MRTLTKKEIDEITNIYAPMGTWFVAKIIEYVKKYGKDGNTLYSDLQTAEMIIEEKSFEKEMESTEEDI